MGTLTAALLARIRGHSVYFDSNFFIYFLSQRGKYYEAAKPIMRACDEGQFIGVTGHLAMSEVLVHPYRQQSPEEIARVKALFAREGFLEIVGHDEKTFDLAAQIRARHGLKLIDALHYATALNAGCRFLISNHTDFKASNTIEVVRLDSLLADKT